MPSKAAKKLALSQLIHLRHADDVGKPVKLPRSERKRFKTTRPFYICCMNIHLKKFIATPNVNLPLFQVLHELLQRDLIQKDEVEHTNFLLSHRHGCDFLCMWQKVMNFFNVKLILFFYYFHSILFHRYHNSD